MAYKPPKQTIVDNDLNYVPSNEAVFEALKLKLDEPTVSGTNGQLLQLTGYVGGEATTSWINPPNPLPSQTGNLDKVLVTDGTNASWQYAGLGAGSLGTNNVVLGRSKPTSISGAQNIILGAPSGNPDGGAATANAITTGNNNLIAGIGTAYALTTGVRNTFLGHLASGDVNTGSDNVVAGWSANWGNTTARSDSQNVIIGATAAYGIDAGNPTHNNSVLVGYSANSFRVSNSCVVIGHTARMANAVSNTNSASIVIGRNANADNLSNIFTVGSDAYPINTAYFGKGALAIAGASLTNFTLTVGRASGTNQSAATGTLTLAGSQGTGTGVGGDVIIATAPAGASGSTLNAHVERMRVAASNGVVTFGNFSGALTLQSLGNLTRLLGINTVGFEIDNTSGINLYNASQLYRSSDASNPSVSTTSSSGWGASFTRNQWGRPNQIFSRSGISVNMPTTLPAQGMGLIGAYGVPAWSFGSTTANSSTTITVTQTGGILPHIGLGDRVFLTGLSGTKAFVTGITNSTTFTVSTALGDGVARAINVEKPLLNLQTQAGAQSVYVDYDGNVGISTNTPTQKLDVSGNIQATSGDVMIATAGKGLAIKTGSNAKIGTATFTAQNTVTVNTTAVTANSLIFVTGQDGVDAFCVGNKVAGTSFDIVHSTGNVTAVVAWMIVEATP